MSINDLDSRISNDVRNKIIISNIKGEYKKMSRNRRKIVAIASCIVILAGGYISVDAANNGEITNTIKEKISSFVVKVDEQEVELQPGKEENGYVYYEYEKDDEKIEIQVNEDELEDVNSKIKITTDEEGTNVTIDDDSGYALIYDPGLIE